jgi:metalloendopeptidase OMA1, mitochondrial
MKPPLQITADKRAVARLDRRAAESPRHGVQTPLVEAKKVWFSSLMKTLNLFVLLLTLVLMPGCVTNPETGRRQLMLISGSDEMQLGVSSFQEMKKETPISKDPEANAMLRRVGERIKSVVNLPDAQWEFVVFESKEANAFCLPGGKIGVYTGILPIVRDDEGLAAVIGHEVAHATLHHGAERMSRGLASQVIGQGLGAAVNAKDPRWAAAFGQLYGVSSAVAVELPHSRKQESEADHRGLIYMAKAGYDPEAAVKFWERFSEYAKRAGGGGTPTFLRTHPDDGTRIKQLKGWMPEAKREYRPR